ncbi:MAG: 2Fe-2S iron-sulfur cluster binding domain-containing protein [Treponema sp.]|nr:2Fe-2S iron-sulfur cluster binding domain-containing protein [Treponema sp.]
MARKAHVSVKGYVADLLGWFKLPKQRSAWIDQGNPNLDTLDPIMDLANRLHSGIIPVLIQEVKEEGPFARSYIEWNGSIWALVEEGPCARSYILKPAEGQHLPLHYAGQYLSAKFDREGRRIARPFTISSGPMSAFEDNLVKITLMKREGDPLNAFIWDTWKAGMALDIELPFGNFYYSKIRDAAHVVGIAEGARVAAFRSMIIDMQKTRRPERLTLLYSSPGAEDTLFRDELNSLAGVSDGRVRVCHVLSGAEAGSSGIEKGPINGELIKGLVPDYREASFFMSGSSAFMEGLGGELDSLGISTTRRRTDVSGPGPLKDRKEKTYTITVQFGLEEQQVPAKSTETVEAALEKAGLAIDTRCRGGECSWCRSKLVTGKVYAQGAGVRAKDREAGFIHPCAAYPESDLTLRVFTRL